MLLCSLALELVLAIQPIRDFSVDARKLPGWHEKLPAPPMFAGTMPASSSVDPALTDDGDLFFWLAEPTGTPATSKQEKLAIWLQGGPGCSSMAGFFVENGPFRVLQQPAARGTLASGAPPSVDELRLEWNPHAWSEEIPTMWVEQPVGVGFATAAAKAPGSSPRLAANESQVAAAFHEWLSRWLATPQFAERYADAEIYFFGESYAGHYVPMIVHHIQRKNAQAKAPIKLGGMAVGNGWYDPMTQNPAYTSYAFGHGLIDAAGKRSLDARWAACDKKNAAYMLDGCGMQEAVQAAAGHVNEYDIDLFGEYTFLQVRAKKNLRAALRLSVLLR